MLDELQMRQYRIEQQHVKNSSAERYGNATENERYADWTNGGGVATRDTGQHWQELPQGARWS